ncbi:MAG: hypothetical protein ABSB59_30770 [Streptosporangiaceae bacterium]
MAGCHGARRGTYRVVYRIDEQAHVVEVLDIDHRGDIYHRSLTAPRSVDEVIGRLLWRAGEAERVVGARRRRGSGQCPYRGQHGKVSHGRTPIRWHRAGNRVEWRRPVRFGHVSGLIDLAQA